MYIYIYIYIYVCVCVCVCVCVVITYNSIIKLNLKLLFMPNYMSIPSVCHLYGTWIVICYIGSPICSRGVSMYARYLFEGSILVTYCYLFEGLILVTVRYPQQTIFTTNLFLNPPAKHGQSWRRYADDNFRCVFVNRNVCILIEISLKFVRRNAINNKASIGLHNGLATSRRHAIIGNNADPIHWRIYAALGGRCKCCLILRDLSFILIGTFDFD